MATRTTDRQRRSHDRRALIQWMALAVAAILGLLAAFILAKVFEMRDCQFFELTGGFVSGHTMKHLFAAMAAAFAIQMWRRRRTTPDWSAP